MKRSVFFSLKELAAIFGIIKKYSFKIINTRVDSALLSKTNRQLSQDFTPSWVNCAHFYETDCFECLPLNIKAV